MNDRPLGTFLKMSAARKAAFFVVAALSVFLVIMIIAVYMVISQRMRDTIGQDYSKMAQLMSRSIARIADRNIEYADAQISAPFIINAVIENNSKYTKGYDETVKYLMDIDVKWVEAQDDHPMIKSYLASALCSQLNFEMSKMKKVLEIMITDKYGALVTATRRVHDYYYGNKSWWQAAFNAGKGRSCIGDIAYDESLGVWTISLMLPIKDSTGNVIGVVRFMEDISTLCYPLQDFKFGRTGRAALVDDKSYLVYYENAKPYSNKFCESKGLDNMLQSKRKWLTMSGIYGNAGAVLMGFDSVNSQYLAHNGINWIVVVLMDAREAFGSLNKMMVEIAVTAFIIIGLSILAVWALFYGLFGASIDKLRDAMDGVRAGNLGTNVDIKSGDEIEYLANSFNIMAKSLKEAFVPASNLNAEVSGRHMAEKALMKLSSEIQRIFNVFDEMIFIIDTNFNITNVNSAFIKGVGWAKAEDMLGKKYFDVLGDIESFPGFLVDAHALIRKEPHIEERHDALSGRSFKVTVIPVFNEYNELMSIIHVAKDMSEIKRMVHEFKTMDENAKRAGRMKYGILLSIARLRDPMQTAEESVGSILSAQPSLINEKSKKAIDGVKANIDKLKKSVDELVEVAAIEKGELELRTESVDLRNIVKKVIFEYEPKVRSIGLDFKLNIPIHSMNIKADVGLISQVFGYLLDNAIKYTDKGHIGLSLTDISNDIECCVSDTGKGISKNSIPNIFDLFQGDESTDDTRSDKTGFGLFIVYGVIKAHKGKVWAESEAGKGTSIHFTIPKS